MPTSRTTIARRIAGLSAIALIALAVSGCSGSQYGAAAVVDGERIPMATVEASVVSLMDQRRAAGEQDTGTVRSGEEAQTQMRFHILSVMLRQVAEARGITISEGERAATRQQVLNSVGSEEALLVALTQNGIAQHDFVTYLDDVIYQKKLGEALVPGEGPDIDSQRNDAVQKVLQEKLESAKITVNPRFGNFDKKTGLLMDRDTTNGVVTLPTE